MASQPVTGKTSLSSSYSTRPTSCLSWSRVRSARISSGVSELMCPRIARGDNMCNAASTHCTTCTVGRRAMDRLDRNLLELFAAEPRVGVLEASRRLGVARGTVQARLDRLQATGVVTGWGPDLDPRAMGYPVTAFLTLEIRQGRGHDLVARHLAASPEVIEAHTITGAGDMWCRVVARSNTDLQRVIDTVLDDEGIVRSSTVIALATQVPFRVLPLLSVVEQ